MDAQEWGISVSRSGENRVSVVIVIVAERHLGDAARSLALTSHDGQDVAGPQP
jgi:hypothetical protein